MASTCEIRIYDPNFQWLNTTMQAESVQFNCELYGVGKFEIHLHPDKIGALDILKRGNTIIIERDKHKSGIIRDFTVDESRNKKEFAIFGETGAGMTKQRQTVPPTQAQDAAAFGWDKIRGNAETVMKHYAGRNLVTPFDPKRAIPHLVMAKDGKRGVEVPWKSRYAKLDEELYNIGSYAEMGYEITADATNKQWVFDVIQGVDRTKSQTAVSPVSFNLAYQNVDSYKYMEDFQNYKNTGYAGGQGDDEKRLIYTIGAAATGLDRHETFLDCGNAANITELMYYGDQKLNLCKEAKTIEVLALPKAFVYDKDYFLGDKVTVSIARLGLVLDTRITAVKEVWERQSGHRVEVRFGGRLPNLFTVLNNTQEVR